MTDDSHTFLDTDMQLFRVSADLPVRQAAQAEFDGNHPTAISAFSLVEFKATYIQDLILLHKKISTSDSFETAGSKVVNSGGRKAYLMFCLLIKALGGAQYAINPWAEAKNELLTHINAQVSLAWQGMLTSIDKVFDDFRCTRALEEPDDDGTKWNATIHRCRKDNTKCSIVDFMNSHSPNLQKFVADLSSLTTEETTLELVRCANVAKSTLQTGEFPWQNNVCRGIGDLLIALQCKVGKKIVSSNHKEHSRLSKSLNYVFQEFPVAAIRSK